MYKYFSASLLALGVAFAMPANAAYDHLYIQDANAPITFTFGVEDSRAPGERISYSSASAQIWVATLDGDGNFVDNWVKLFDTKGQVMPGWTPDHGKATLVPGSSSLDGVDGDPYSFTFTASTGAYEVVFMFYLPESKVTYYSDSLGLNGGGRPRTEIFYGSDWARLGFEDYTDFDYNDVFITIKNVGATPAIPEPETYAMMLAGLGMIGAIARRRRIKSQ
jgi:hypothetical protein